MNKKIMIFTGIIILIIISIVTVIIVLNNNNNNKKNNNISNNSNNISNINTNNNSKELELTYKTNGGVPYKWEYEIENKDIVEFVKSYEVENKNKDGIVGASISTNYVFKGIKEGTTTITFKYVSIVDGSIDQKETHNVKVDNNQNISLI